MRILIKDTLIIPMTSPEPYSFYGNVGIENNIIIHLEPQDSTKEFKADTIIDGKGKALMPGMINCHTHAGMSLLRGYADDMPLMPWLNDKIWPYEAKLKGEDIALGTKLSIAEMLLGGTTSFADMYFSQKEVYSVVQETGIRASISFPLLDFNRANYQENVDSTLELHKRENCPRIDLLLAPHAPYTLTVENLEYVSALAKEYNLGIHTHLCETKFMWLFCAGKGRGALVYS